MNARLPRGFAPILRAVFEESKKRGAPLYAVGGCVRDWLLGLETKDLDLVGERDPGPIARFVARRWGGKAEIFERFGTARVLLRGGLRLDLARAREESYPEPAALPEVRPGTLRSDLVRRDFTINAMAASLSERGFGELFDPHGGAADLRRKVLRVLHPGSFRDDPTRMFRAARFACRFSFDLDESTETHRRAAVEAGLVRLLSRERLRGELVRVLEERHPQCALDKLVDWKLAEPVHPRFAWPKNLEKGEGPWERLGMMALRMGSPDGDELVQSLHLEREVSLSLLEALVLARERASPRVPVSPLTARVLRKSLPKLPPKALEPLWIGGRDLQQWGMTAGPQFKEVLQDAARAQWSGEYSTRAQALRWLKTKLAKRKSGAAAR